MASLDQEVSIQLVLTLPPIWSELLIRAARERGLDIAEYVNQVLLMDLRQYLINHKEDFK